MTNVVEVTATCAVWHSTRGENVEARMLYFNESQVNSRSPQHNARPQNESILYTLHEVRYVIPRLPLRSDSSSFNINHANVKNDRRERNKGNENDPVYRIARWCVQKAKSKSRRHAPAGNDSFVYMEKITKVSRNE